MAVTHIESNANTNPGSPSTSFTMVIPAAVVAGDILLLSITNDGGAQPAVTDNDSGGNAWVRKNPGTGIGSLWWKRATGGTASKTISVSGGSTKMAAVQKVLRGCLSAGDPFDQITSETNATPSDVAHAGFTPSRVGCWIGLAVFASTSSGGQSPNNLRCTNPGTLTQGTFDNNSGAPYASLNFVGDVQASLGATGGFAWGNQVSGGTFSIAFAILPEVPAATGTLAATDVADVASMAGTVTGNYGTLAATEAAADVASFVGATSPGYRQSVQVYIAGAPVGARKENQGTSLADDEFDITGERNWTPADFRDGNFAVHVGSHSGPASVGLWDCLSVRITYQITPVRTGILAVVEAPDVAAITGHGPPELTGALAASEAADVAALIGQVIAHGALIGIEGIDVAAFAGVVSTGVALAATEAADVAAFAGQGLDLSGILAATEAGDGAAILGAVGSAGVVAATEAPDTVAILGAVVTTGTLAVTEASDVAAFAGGAVVGGVLAATEAADFASFVGAGIGINGGLAATDAPDAANFVGKVASVGTLAASEAADVAAFIGEAVALLGTLAAVEAADVAAIIGGGTATGILAATEAPDVAAFAGKTINFGALAATDAPDTALAVGSVVWRAVLAATEQADTAAFTGAVTLAGIINATEAADGAAFAGAIINVGALDATEEPDRAFFFQTSIVGFFAALEAGDNAIIFATGGDYALDIIGDEDPHNIHGGCEGVPNIKGTAQTPTIKGRV